jgi:hypothetical protein
MVGPPFNFFMTFHHFSIFPWDYSFFFPIFCASSPSRALCAHHLDYPLLYFEENKNKAIHARVVPPLQKMFSLCCILLLSLYFFSTTTSQSTHYESLKPQLCEVQVFDTNRSQSLLIMPGRVQKNIFFLPSTL